MTKAIDRSMVIEGMTVLGRCRCVGGGYVLYLVTVEERANGDDWTIKT